jgi:hypothetical protein
LKKTPFGKPRKLKSGKMELSGRVEKDYDAKREKEKGCIFGGCVLL